MKDIRTNLIKYMFEALYTEGYHACNLNAILQKAGTSKGGMYHHFDSKQALAIEAIDEVIGHYVKHYWEDTLEQSENSLQTLYENIRNLSKETTLEHFGIRFEYGCPLNNLIQELSASDEVFSQVLQTLFKRWETAIVKALTRVKKDLRIDVEIVHAASFIIASIEGSFSYAKVYNSKDAFGYLMDQLIAFIKSLLR